ncbi:hypothetical protein [Aminobacter sp. LjRoot7]|uniref:hypothetical protein n=1 Tax=Aminobacter sp. LjRoot7 TaxID=3342335 RepID=UPI003ECDEFCF
MHQENIAALADRVADIRILREHHVWAAAELFGFDDFDATRRRKFRALMEADALLDAVLLLAASARPSRSVENISSRAGHWQCCMRHATAGGSRTCTAEHADLAAAVLASLLASFQQPAPARRRTLSHQHDGSSSHEHHRHDQ